MAVLLTHCAHHVHVQALFGACNETWMDAGNYCAQTCGREPCAPVPLGAVREPANTAVAAVPELCTDSQPDSKLTCAEQKALGKCNETWMTEGGYCAGTRSGPARG